MDKHKYHIYLVTTQGCYGCKIQQRRIEEALDIVKADIKFHVSDYTKFKHSNPEYDKFKDFPTTLYVADGETLARDIGTKPTPLILNKIYACFHVHPPKFLEDILETS